MKENVLLRYVHSLLEGYHLLQAFLPWQTWYDAYIACAWPSSHLRTFELKVDSMELFNTLVIKFGCRSLFVS